MRRHCVFFDYGGTIEQTTGSIVVDAEFCADARRQLRPALTGDGLRSAGRLLEDDEALAERVRDWLAAEIQRKRFAETESTTGSMWMEILAVAATQVTSAFSCVAEELTCTLETRKLHKKLRPNIREAVIELCDSGWQVGIISNMVTRRRMPRELEEFGLTPLFAPVVQSSEYGYRKPDPSIFHHAARLAGVPAKMCWYVGDTYSRDVLGARRAGYAGVVHLTGTDDVVTDQLRSSFDPGFFEPDASIDDLADLPAILKRALDSRRERHSIASIGSQWVKALVFDASDVLYYRPAKGETFAAFLARRGIPAVSETGGSKTIELEKRAFTGEIGREEHYREIVLTHNITEPELIEEGIRALEADSDRVDYFEGIPETLRALSEQGVRLAVVSNTVLPLHDKLRFFEQGGFGDVWDSIILSIDVGVRKPDPAIYLHAAEHLGLPPDECAFVGHEPYEITGARAAGMRTVSFNCNPPIGAERHVGSFAELIDLIATGDH